MGTVINKILIDSVFLILIFNSVLSQTNEWVNYTYPDGISDFAETEDFYWVSTMGGLVKIDKKDSSTEVLNKTNSPFRSNVVGSLCVDSEDNLWVGARSNDSQKGGLLKFDGKKWESLDLEDDYWSDHITELTVDNNGHLWFGMGDGVAKYDGDSLDYKQIVSPLAAHGISLKKIVFDKDENAWFLDDNGTIWAYVNGDFDVSRGKILSTDLEQDTVGDLWILEKNKLKCFSGSDNINNLSDGHLDAGKSKIIFKDSIAPQAGDSIRFFRIDEKNNFYVSFKTKIGILKDGAWTYLNNANSQLPLGSFSNLFVSSDDNLWANVFMDRTKNRIFKYDLATWEDHTKQLSNSGLRNNYIKNIATDDSDNKWVVNHLLENTLIQIKDSNWTDFDISKISELNALFTLRYDSDTLKIWNDNSIVIRYDLKKNIWSLSDNTKSQSSDMKIDDAGTIWWCVDKGLQKYNGVTWELFLSENTVASICFDNSNTLYASTLPPVDKPGRIFSYKNNSWEEVITCSGDAKWVYSMTVDNENNLWFGVLDRLTVGHEFGDGLYKYDGQNFVHYVITNSDIPGNSVVYVRADKDNSVWVGTYGDGLSLFRDNVWKNYNASNSPLSGNSVEIIERDRQGNVWASCQFSGITFIPYSEFSLTATKDMGVNIIGHTVKVYPNPSFGNLSIDFTLEKGSLCNMTLYDIYGRKVFSSMQKYYPSGINTQKFNFSNQITKGIYFLDVKIGESRSISRIVIK